MRCSDSEAEIELRAELRVVIELPVGVIENERAAEFFERRAFDENINVAVVRRAFRIRAEKRARSVCAAIRAEFVFKNALVAEADSAADVCLTLQGEHHLRACIPVL